LGVVSKVAVNCAVCAGREVLVQIIAELFKQFELALTVRVARLLVRLPAELLTATENVDPLSDVAVTGVV
jgi:hypothetical protein